MTFLAASPTNGRTACGEQRPTRKKRLPPPSVGARRLSRVDAPAQSRTIVHTKIIADTNTFIAVALNEPEKRHIIHLTEGRDLAAPDVLPFEIGNALTAMMKKASLKSDEIQTSCDIIQNIPVELRRIDIKAALDIAATFDIYAYDAYFLECAGSLKCPLITLDAGMQRIAQDMGILVLE